MNAEQRNKINKLQLSATPKGLLFSDWLKKNGYSDQLIKRYRESGWLAMLSKGSHVSQRRQLVCICFIGLLQQTSGQDIPSCSTFRVGTVWL